MARYIELVGVPGVGKTSTYKYLKNIQTEKDNWKLLEDIFRKPPPKQVGLKRKTKTFIKGLLGLPTIPKVKIAHDNKVLFDFMAQNEELIDIFWDIIMTKNLNFYGKDLRFTTVNYMMMVFKNLQAIKDNPSDKCFLLDEGIILNMAHFTNEELEETLDSQISKILDKIFLPSGIILFEGDLDTVMERTKIRGKLKVEDEHLSEEMIRKSREKTAWERRKYVSAVESRNIPVLRLDAKDSIEYKAKKIAEFAEKTANEVT
jgi:hypothetical protein